MFNWVEVNVVRIYRLAIYILWTFESFASEFCWIKKVLILTDFLDTLSVKQVG